MRKLDGFVDFAGGAEIIGGDDEVTLTIASVGFGATAFRLSTTALGASALRLQTIVRPPRLASSAQRAISRRSRRKWKNSMPSRSRRFIMSGLRIISPTIDAILPERK